MIKKKKSIRVKIPAIRLYLEDLKEIEGVFNENTKEHQIETNEFEYKNLEECLNHQTGQGIDILNDVSFSSHNPYISLEFKKDSAALYGSEDSTNTYGIIHKIQAILRKRFRFVRYFANAWFPLLLIILLNLIPRETAGYLAKYSIPLAIAILVSYILIIFLFLIWGFRLSMINHSIVHLKNRNSYEGFFTRKKDEIIISLISAIVGAIISVIVMAIFIS